ncbi:GFA family protein [Xanthomonas codiaei]|uniref:GFA family protein n=2 Tax=Xanthomonas TaxID=338 RepID=UPI001E38C32A|nr:GFA family protein [Xanthomonas codiaei]MCC8538732.1 GFA family protein [Xanthomonas codiaei]
MRHSNASEPASTMVGPALPLHGRCACGACTFDVHARANARFRCHCLICQAFNGSPYADVVAVRGKDVVLHHAGNIAFKKHRSPPNFDRGTCRVCGRPVIEIAGAGALKVMFIPVANFDTGTPLPPVRMDIFYHRRVHDMPDGAPRYCSYFSSELAVGRLILRGL